MVSFYYSYDTVKLRKPELIIRENEPLVLPPDVIRGIHFYLACHIYIIRFVNF